MSKAIDDLTHEHDAILFTLDVLGKMILMINEMRLNDTGDPKQLINFLKEFADKCHHGKEEIILFPEMEKAGIENEHGPIGMMLIEHQKGREFIKAMEDAISKNDLKAFSAEAIKYVNLLRQHIKKENTILFPMGEKALKESTLNKIYEKFEEHEEKVIGKGRHEELHALLNIFEEKYIK